jgi:cytochrome c553
MPKQVRLSLTTFLLSIATFAIAGCDDATAGLDACSSSEASNADEGETMEPGGTCISCHAEEGEGPDYTIAGTVMGDYHDDQRCVGVEGATIILTGADGATVELTSNRVGNFFYQGKLAKPYTAKITTAEGERAMAAAQTDGDCNSCHSAEGSSSAPGRIIAP